MKLIVLPVLVTAWLLSHTTQAKSPILIINGILGSSLFVRDDRRTLFGTLPHKCNTLGTFKRLWVDLVRLPLCGIDELSMEYDAATGQFSDAPDVTIQVQGFGDTRSVEALDGLGVIPYFRQFVNYFVARGYERGKSIRAAPYDWRLAANELERRGYFANLRDLVETMYRDNGNRKVTMVVHSMGGLVSHYFLTRYSGINQAWKDKHIHAYVPLSGAWSGGVAALASVISGQQIFGDIDFLNELLANFLVPIGQMIPSIPWLLPRTDVFGNQVLVRTQDRAYTASDYQQLFNQVGFKNGFEVQQNLLRTVTPNFPAPNVPTHCLYGVGVDTPLIYEYNSLDNQPTRVVNGNGDGTVNLVSSEVCLNWRNMPNHPFKSKELNGVGHIPIVSDRQVLQYIEEVVDESKRLKNLLLKLLMSRN